MSIRSLFEKVKLRPVVFTVSNTRKVHMSIMSFSALHFAAQGLKDLHIKQRKNEHYWVSQQTLHVKKFRALKMSNISHRDVKVVSKVSDLTCQS